HCPFSPTPWAPSGSWSRYPDPPRRRAPNPSPSPCATRPAADMPRTTRSSLARDAEDRIMNTTSHVARGRYIPWLFAAGFAIVFAVNATMVGVAVGSFSGLYTPKPRDRGLHFNEVIAA